MATAAAPGPQGVNRREMVESKAPDQFQFNKAGQTVSGILLAIEPIDVKGKQALEYTFLNERRERFTCLGTADLNKKIIPGFIGHLLDIRYESDDASFQKQGQSPMKVFKVMVSKEKEPGF